MKPIVIIGGGPAGSAMGCYLSQNGIPNVILEKANHPRPHVGESLVMTTIRVFREIGFLETLEREGFVKKYGALWHAPLDAGTTGIKFSEFPLPDIEQVYTYHVDRGRMDHLLLKHAEQLGSKVYQGVHVTKVLFDEREYAAGVTVEIAGKSIDIEAAAVVDASGRNTILGRQLKWLEKDEMFDQFCVHAWYEGVDRGKCSDANDIHIYFLPATRAWSWQIPITEEITSVGIVTAREAYGRGQEGWFEEQVKAAPNLAHAMRNAVRINEFKREGDYSYCMKRFCGNGFVLIGDAGRFVDPIFSSGVSVALTSAKFASERILAAWKANDFSEKMLKPFEEVQRKGTSIWYEFICLYYRALPMFTHFVQDPTYRSQIHRLLQGDVYDREDVPVLDKIREYISTIEQTENHLFRGHLDDTVTCTKKYPDNSQTVPVSSEVG